MRRARTWAAPVSHTNFTQPHTGVAYQSHSPSHTKFTQPLTSQGWRLSSGIVGRLEGSRSSVRRITSMRSFRHHVLAAVAIVAAVAFVTALAALAATMRSFRHHILAAIAIVAVLAALAILTASMCSFRHHSHFNSDKQYIMYIYIYILFDAVCVCVCVCVCAMRYQLLAPSSSPSRRYPPAPSTGTQPPGSGS